MPGWTTWRRGKIPRSLGCETRSVVTILSELSGSYFGLDAGSWSSDDRRTENFDKSSAEFSVLLACDTGLLIGSHQMFQIKHSKIR